MIVGDYPPRSGGIGVYVKEVSDRLVRDGYKVTVLTRNRDKISALDHYFENGVEVYRIFCPPIYPFHIFFHKILTEYVFNKLKNDIDILHFHSPIVPMIDTKLDKVATMHGTVSSGIGAMQNSDIYTIFTKLFANQFRGYEKRVVKNSNKILPISCQCMNELIKEYKLNKDMLSVVKNGVDTKIFTANGNIKSLSNPLRLLYVGRINSQKGLVDLVDCANILVKIYRIDVKCIVIGDSYFKNKLRNYVSSLNLDEKFEFPGYIQSRDSILKYYNSSDIFILPSYSEGCPTVLLEAMSCGLPCIATNVGGIPEIIHHEVTGLLIEPRNPCEMAEAVLRLSQDRELRAELVDNALRFVRKNHEWDLIMKQLEKIYINL